MQPTLVPDEILSRVATLLGTDVPTIKLKSPAFAISEDKCRKCNSEITFYDFVKSAYDSEIHSKEYMTKFFLGAKGMEKNMRTTVNCASCGTPHDVDVMYRYQGPHTCS